MVRPGADNYLAVRVIDSAASPATCASASAWGATRCRTGVVAAIAGGIQAAAVRLTATGPVRIADLLLLPEPRTGEVEVAVAWENTAARSGAVRDAARHPAVGDAGQCGEQHANPGGACWTRHLARRACGCRARHSGDLEQPNLYHLKVALPWRTGTAPT